MWIPARSSAVWSILTTPAEMVTALFTFKSKICPSSKVKVAEFSVEAPPATTDKEPDLVNAPAPPKTMPPPAAPCWAGGVETVGARAIVPPATVVPLETAMSITLVKRVVLVKVTSLLAVLGPELNAAKVPL
ncbi:hypothetical protein MCERE1_03396 [Burkholderiaceae bacterium]